MIKFQPGDRIRISSNSSWAIGAKGTIAQPPDFAVRRVEDEAPWQGHHRFVKGRQEFIEFFWVWFDEPQIDADGDGPYKGGEFEMDAIDLLL